MTDQPAQSPDPGAGSLWQRILTDSFEEIYVFDAETLRFIQVSRGALDNLGYSMDEMLALTAADIKPELSLAEFSSLIDPLQRGEEDLVIFETRHRRKDGSRYPVEVRLQLATDASPPVYIAIILDRTEREQALQDMRQSETRFSEAQRIAHVGSWQLDLCTSKLEWSAEIFRIFEIDAQKFGASYEAFLEAIHPDDRERVNAAYLNSLESRRPYEIEHRLLMKDGRVKFVQERCETSFDDTGKPLRSVGTVQDISKRKLAETAARENEQRFHLLAQISPVGIFRTDAQGLCLYVNERWQDMAGLTEAQAKGEGWIGGIHPDDRERVFRNWKHAVQTKTLYRVECRLIQSTPADVDKRKVTWVLAQASPELDNNGDVIGYVGTTTDIGLQKRIEAALSKIAAAGTGPAFFQHLVQGLVKLFDAQAAFVCKFPSDPTLKTENLATAFSGNRNTGVLGGINCCGLVDSPCSRTIKCQSLFTVESGLNKQFADNVCALTLTENAESFIGTPLLGSEGSVTGIMGIVNDEPLANSEALQPILEMFAARASTELERQKAEKTIRNQRDQLEKDVRERTSELMASNQELESFAYSVSHDLRAPLRAIDGFSLALLDDYGSSLDETASGYLQRVRLGTQRMGGLIDDMLQLSRVTRSEFTPQCVDLSVMAQDVFNLLQEISPERKVHIEIAPAMEVTGDKRLLGVLLDNLLGNAWKYSSKCDEACIEFGCMPVEGKPVFFVRDNGVGFNQKYADKAFEAFQRLHVTSDFEGSGVGLATVQRVVKRHGGRVWADAEIDKGATFYFTLEC